MPADPHGIVPHLNGLTQRRRAAERLHGDTQTQVFRIPVIGGTGRATISTHFNFAFTVKPSHSVGVDIAEGDVIIGPTPTARIVVRDWERAESLIVGARFDVLTVGHPRQRLVVVVHFSGRGLTLPLGNSLDNTSFDDII